jgi:hypothetical protein
MSSTLQGTIRKSSPQRVISLWMLLRGKGDRQRSQISARSVSYTARRRELIASVNVIYG